LRRDCPLKRVNEGKIEERLEVKGIRGKRCELKEKVGYSKLKEEALDRIVWTVRFGRGFEPVVRQTTDLNELLGVEIMMRGCVSVLMIKADFWNFICC